MKLPQIPLFQPKHRPTLGATSGSMRAGLNRHTPGTCAPTDGRRCGCPHRHRHARSYRKGCAKNAKPDAAASGMAVGCPGPEAYLGSEKRGSSCYPCSAPFASPSVGVGSSIWNTPVEGGWFRNPAHNIETAEAARTPTLPHDQAAPRAMASLHATAAGPAGRWALPRRGGDGCAACRRSRARVAVVVVTR